MSDGPYKSQNRQPASPASNKTPKWRDIPYIFVLLVFIIGFIVIAVFDLSDYRKTQCFKSYFGDPRVIFFEPIILGILAISILVSFVISGIYYSIAALYTDDFIIMSMTLQIAVSLGTSVFYLSQSRFLSGAFSVFWLIASCVIYWLLRSHIAAASIQLDITMRVAERNPSIILISVLGALFCAGWSILVGSITLAGLGKAITEDCSVRHMLRSESEFLTLLAYLTMCNYLVAEVVKATVRISICYTYGWWCFLPSVPGDTASPTPITHDEFPSIPFITWMGLLAGMTYSLGSLCLSSIILAITKLVAQVVAAWSQTLLVNGPRLGSQDVSAILLAWVLSNCATYVDSILSHFTNYVIVYIAVDNVSYLEGFKRSLYLLYNEGVNALINDCLACGTLTFGSWCIGAISTLMIYIYMRFIQCYPSEGVFFICSFVMVVNVQVSSVLTTGISSGVQTLFVAMSAEPSRLRQAHPQLCDLLARYLL